MPTANMPINNDGTWYGTYKVQVVCTVMMRVCIFLQKARAPGLLFVIYVVRHK